MGDRRRRRPFQDLAIVLADRAEAELRPERLRCGLDFFGPDHVVFAGDCPVDPEGGPMFIREGVRSVEDLDLSDDLRERICFRNAQWLMKLVDGG